MKQFAVGCACCSFLPPRRVDREKSLSGVDMWVPAGFQFYACVAAAALLGRKGRGCARALQSPARGKVSMASGIGKQVGFSVAFPFDAPSGVFTMHVCPGGLRRLDRGRNPEVERGRSYGRCMGGGVTAGTSAMFRAARMGLGAVVLSGIPAALRGKPAHAAPARRRRPHD